VYRIPGGITNATGVDGRIVALVFIGLAIMVIIERLIKRK
jgi:hypothetical protein